jgi:hypothetical protein
MYPIRYRGTLLGAILVPPLDTGFHANNRRKLSTVTTYPSVSQPVVCIRIGDGVVFDISKGFYPVYMKDSLLNTNPTFDYGEFRSLSEAAISAANVTSFVYTFREAGLYDIGNVADRGQRMLIAVMAPGSECPTDATIVPMQSDVLLRLGARQSEGLLLNVNWRVVLAVALVFIILASVTIIGALYFQRRAWTGVDPGRPSYKDAALRLALERSVVSVPDKALAKPTTKVAPKTGTQLTVHTANADSKEGDEFDSLERIASSFTLLFGGSVRAQQAQRSVMDLDRWDDDDLDLREIIERLEVHAAIIDQGFVDRTIDSEQLWQTIQTEAADIKRLLSKAVYENRYLINGSEGTKDHATIERLGTDIVQELTNRSAFDIGFTDLEKALMSSISALSTLLVHGVDAVSQQLAAQLKGAMTSNSKSALAQAIDDRIEVVQGVLDAMAGAVAQERGRRAAAVPIWRAAAELAAMMQDSSIVVGLEKLQMQEAGMDGHVRRFMEIVQPFGTKAPTIRKDLQSAIGDLQAQLTKTAKAIQSGQSITIANDASAFENRLAAGDEDEMAGESKQPQNDSAALKEAVKETRVAFDKVRTNVFDLISLLSTLHSLLPTIRQKADQKREQLDAGRGEFMEDVGDLLDYLDQHENIKFKHLWPEQKLEHLLEQVQRSLGESGGIQDETEQQQFDELDGVDMYDEAYDDEYDDEGAYVQALEGVLPNMVPTDVFQSSITQAAEENAARIRAMLTRDVHSDQEAYARFEDMVAQMHNNVQMSDVFHGNEQLADIAEQMLMADLNNEKESLQQLINEEQFHQERELQQLMQEQSAKQMEQQLKAVQLAAAQQVAAHRHAQQAALLQKQQHELHAALQQSEITLQQANNQVLSSESALVAHVGEDGSLTLRVKPAGLIVNDDDSTVVIPATMATPAERLREEANAFVQQSLHQLDQEMANLDQETEQQRKQLTQVLVQDRAAKHRQLLNKLQNQRAQAAEKLIQAQANEMREAMDNVLAGNSSPDILIGLASAHSQQLQQLNDEHAVQAQQALFGFNASVQPMEQKYAQDMAELDAQLHKAKSHLCLAMNAKKAEDAEALRNLLLTRKTEMSREIRARHSAESAALPDPSMRAAMLTRHEAENRQLEQATGLCDDLASQAIVAKVSVTQQKLSESDLARQLRKEHDEQVLKLNNATDAERRRQAAEMHKRLAARHARNREAVLRQQAVELGNALSHGASAEQVEQILQHTQDALAAVDGEQSDAVQMESAAMALAVEQAQTKAHVNLQILEGDLAGKLAELHATREVEANGVLSAIQSERRRQAAALQQKLRARQLAKIRNVSQQHANERDSLEVSLLSAANAIAANAQQHHVQVQASVLAAIDAIPGSSADVAAQMREADARAAQQRAQLDAEYDSHASELMVRQISEQHNLEQQLELERQRVMEDADEEARRALEAKRRDLENRLNARNSNTAEDAHRIREEFQHEMHLLESSQDEERMRQKAKLDKQLEGRKAKKARELLKKQEHERLEEGARHEKALAELEAAQAAQKEKALLTIMLAASQSSASKHAAASAGEAVEAVLRKRHTDETAALVARQYSERADKLRRVVEAVYERRREEKLRLLERLAAAGTHPADIAAASAQLDARYEVEKKSTVSAELETIEVRHAKEQLALKHRQLNEINMAFKELAPHEVARRQEAAQAAQAAEDLAKFQNDIEERRMVRMESFRNERQTFEEAMRKENDEEIAKLEAEHNALLEKERLAAEDQLRARKENLEREKEELRKIRLTEAAHLDEETRARIMQEFDDNQERMQEKLEAIRLKQQKKLEAQLNERRGKKLAKAQKEFEERRIVQEQERALKREQEIAAEKVAKEAAAKKQASRALELSRPRRMSDLATRKAALKTVASTASVAAPAAPAKTTATGTPVKEAPVQAPAAAASAVQIVRQHVTFEEPEKSSASIKQALLNRIKKLEIMLNDITTLQQANEAAMGQNFSVSSAARAVAINTGKGASGEKVSGDVPAKPVEVHTMPQAAAHRLFVCRNVVQAMCKPVDGAMTSGIVSPTVTPIDSIAPMSDCMAIQSGLLINTRTNTIYVAVPLLERSPSVLLGGLAHAVACLSAPNRASITKSDPDVLQLLHRNLATLALQVFRSFCSADSGGEGGNRSSASFVTSPVLNNTERPASLTRSTSILNAVAPSSPEYFQSDSLRFRLQRYASAAKLKVADANSGREKGK